MSYWDAHSHLADPRLDAERDAVMEAARRVGIRRWIQGGVDPEDWGRQLKLKQKYSKEIVTSFGLHPWWLASASEEIAVAAWRELEASIGKADALGETGLDHARDRKKRPSYALQTKYFELQVKLAQAIGKPLVLHIVGAHAEAISLLKRFQPFPARGIVHSFNDTVHSAKAYIELGFLISVGADATRPPPSKLASVLKDIPADSLVVETDCPDQSPFEGGKRRSGLNQPAFLLEMAEAIGRARNESAEQVLRRSAASLTSVFGNL